ncbi:DUF551 domain-containing protein [Enterobacter asburiae]|uniref:DUF551 domain-containing protein n=1 Tax=Enterobacter asburiae TaxID=61645 RepID=UPI000F82A590|nr:DUF551 domain-containing protein [Enterobacter asburiae]RTN83043.1 DUF551 domain-containing protein [Enterobacter asburiae]RTP81445.1 DUF551 domain-containing protein [Enterobacter asburiae]
MSTFTKEQLQQIEAAAKEVLWPVVWSEKKAREHFSEKITPKLVLKLARIALASLEAEKGAEPVAKVDTIGVCWYADNGVPRKPAVGTELFAAPPAPVSVPNSTTITQYFDTIALETAREIMCYVNRRHEFLGGEVQLLSRIQCQIDDACRAAMLQGADGNSPVITDGWVACSERMPEENAEQEVLACFKGGDISTLYYFEGRWDDAYGIVPIRQDITHWMPLPAAPQQEVK